MWFPATGSGGETKTMLILFQRSRHCGGHSLRPNFSYFRNFRYLKFFGHSQFPIVIIVSTPRLHRNIFDILKQEGGPGSKIRFPYFFTANSSTLDGIITFYIIKTSSHVL